MELLFGNRVRSGNRRIGYLAGVEVDGPSRRVTKIIFSEDGKLGSHAQTRAVEAVRAERGALLVGDAPSGLPAVVQPLLLSRSTRITRSGHEGGHVTGVIADDHGKLETIIGRHHWWTGRSRLPAAELDFSHPGEIRTGPASTRAA